jgi:menaquinone-dependent protoporphyrinogen oxidase
MPPGITVWGTARSIEGADMTRVLIVHASKRGGTAEIAESIGRRLSERGAAVDVVPANRAHHFRAYDAVVVGSALYGGRWRRAAVRAVRKLAHLSQPPQVWLFHSGPLDELARDPQPLPGRVLDLAHNLGDPQVATFGGRLAPDTQGFIARAMVRNGKAGDWRDPDAIVAYADEIADRLVPAA